MPQKVIKLNGISIIYNGCHSNEYIIPQGTNFFFIKLTDHGEKVRKRLKLALEKLWRARDELIKDIMKRLDFINKSLRQKNESRAYMIECYQVFAIRIKSLPLEAQLSDFCNPRAVHKNGELLFVTGDTNLATCAVYKYLK